MVFRRFAAFYLFFSSPEEIQQHINRLITQNEAILEPSPLLTKRRTYTRQLNGSTFLQSSGNTTNNNNNSGLGSPREFRSNSMHISSYSPQSGAAAAAAASSGAAARRHSVLAAPGAVRMDYNADMARRSVVMANSTIHEDEIGSPTAAGTSNAAMKFLAQVNL